MIFFLNAINLVTVLASFIVQILIVRFFGASDSTDIYYLIITITTFVTGVSTGFLTDLFVPIYHDAKKRDARDAQRLTGGVLTLSLLSGVLLTVIVYVLAPLIVSVFASGFHTMKHDEAVSMLRIVSLSIVFTSMTMILNSTLNANSYLLVTYLTNLILPVFNVLALLLWGSRLGVAALMYAIVYASMLTFVIVFAHCKFKIGARFSNPLGQKDLSYLLVKNVPVRGANIIHMLRGPLTTTVLSYFPSGFLTLYSYADKIITVLLGTTNSPLAQIFYIKSSQFASQKRYPEIKELLIKTVKSSIMLFVGTVFATILVFQKVFGILFAGKVPAGGVGTMFLIFISLFPFYYVSLVGTELGMTALSLKKGRLAFYASGTFIAIFGFSLIPLVRSMSFYGLPLGLALAQIGAAVVYAISVNRVQPLIGREFIAVQVTTLIFSALMVAANVVEFHNHLLQLATSAGIILLWILMEGRSVVSAMRFITAKGEIK